MEIINVTDEIIEVNVTEEVITIQAPTGAYPLPNAVNSVFGRVGSIIATEGDYTLTQLGDVTLTSPANGQVLKYNGTQWVNSTDADTGITTLNTLTALSQTFATGTSGTDFNISSATSTHTFNLPTASATNRGLLSSADWSTFNAKQNALTNPVTGTGNTNTLPKFTGASTIGNSNISDSGTLITLGSNTTISNGGLQVGTNTLGTTTIRVGKNLTGATAINSVLNDGAVQSDVTLGVFNFRSGTRTAAASFTLTSFTHFFADQTSIGAGSSITIQEGFVVNSNMTGAANNFGFRGLIPSGSNRWNLYMDGMAANFLAGDTGIGTPTLGTATQLTIGGTETAVSAISRGQLINTTLVASANNDVLVGLDINPTYTTGAFTGVTGLGIRTNNIQSGTIISPVGDIINIVPNVVSNRGIRINTANSNILGLDLLRIDFSSNFLDFRYNPSGTATTFGRFFTTGNFTLQNGGTFTDAGFRLDVNGTTRFIGTATTDSPPLGSELLTTLNWTSTGWTGDFTTGFTHTTGNTSVLSNTLAAVIGTYYKIQITRSGGTAGSITIGFGGQSRTISNTRSFEPLATTTGNLTITPTSDFDGTILVSVKTIGLASPSFTISPSTGAGQITMRATSVTGNTVIGLSAGQRLSSSGVGDDGANNTFIGNAAGKNSTFTRYCTFIGTQAGELNVTGTDNTSLGYRALYANTGGLENTAIGKQAGENSTGSGNTFVGSTAGQNLLTGGFNIFIGNGAGRTITGGSTANTNTTNSIYIGQGTRAAADNQNNQIVIGQGTTGLGANTTIIGNSSTTITGLYGNIRLVSGMGTAPASSTATGTTGDIVVTAGFIYVCTATNTWVRTALTTW